VEWGLAGERAAATAVWSVGLSVTVAAGKAGDLVPGDSEMEAAERACEHADTSTERGQRRVVCVCEKGLACVGSNPSKTHGGCGGDGGGDGGFLGGDRGLGDGGGFEGGGGGFEQ
jgi:hypothetical protein